MCYLPVKDLGGITADMIAEYLACLRADLCATTYNGRVCILREIFRTLAKKAGLEEDPWEGVRLRPEDSHSRRELTMEELKRLLEAVKKADGKFVTSGEDAASPLLADGRFLTSGEDAASPLLADGRFLTSGEDAASPLFRSSTI